MASLNNPASYGAFVPTTNVWDTAEIYSTEVTSPAFKELLVRLYQNLNNLATLVNLKDTGYYDINLMVNSQLFFPNPAFNSGTSIYPAFRQVFRIVVECGALPSNGIPVPTPHNLTINNGYTFTRIYGCASNAAGTSFLPLPYVSATDVAHNIELSVTNSNVVITSGGHDYSAYTTTYVVLEYLQS